MPGTFNGIGTKYLGRREVGSDGSYVTTEFAVFTWIPVIPLGSYRVLPKGTGSWSWLLIFSSNSQEYFVQKVPLNKRQVFNVYLTVLSLFAAVFIVAYIIDLINK